MIPRTIVKRWPAFRAIPVLLGLSGFAPEASAAPGHAAGISERGTLTLRVDARDAPQMMLHAKMRIPAKQGTLTLVYPKWIPGDHGPTGKVADISGLRFSAGGKTLAWRRDPVELSEFSMNVPTGNTAVDVELDVVVATQWGENTNVSDINWNRVLLYPKGVGARDLSVESSVQLPPDWHYATALPLGGSRPSTEGVVTFQSVSLETLVDSPLVMGRYARTIDLGTALGAPRPRRFRTGISLSSGSDRSEGQTYVFIVWIHHAYSSFESLLSCCARGISRRVTRKPTAGRREDHLIRYSAEVPAAREEAVESQTSAARVGAEPVRRGDIAGAAEFRVAEQVQHRGLHAQPRIQSNIIPMAEPLDGTQRLWRQRHHRVAANSLDAPPSIETAPRLQLKVLGQPLGQVRRRHQIDAGVVAEVDRVEFRTPLCGKLHQLVGIEQGVVDDEAEVPVIELDDLHGRTWIE